MIGKFWRWFAPSSASAESLKFGWPSAFRSMPSPPLSWIELPRIVT